MGKIIYKVYRLTNLVTKKSYIGQTNMDVNKRFYHHTRDYNSCSYIKNSINKYGKENFKVEWVASSIRAEFIDDLEDYFIRYENTLAPSGYNLKFGGSHPTMCDSTKNKMSKSQKERHANISSKDKEIQHRGISKYIEEKRRPLIGINDAYETIRFPSGTAAVSAGYHVTNSLKNNYTKIRGYLFFYEGEYTLDEMKEFLEKRKIERECRKLAGNMKRVNKIKKTVESQSCRNITAVNPETYAVLEYPNQNRAFLDGHSRASVQKSLKGELARSKGFHFFHTKDHTINEMFDIAIETNQKIRDSYLAGRKKAVANMQDHINAQKVSYIGINPTTLEYQIFESSSEAVQLGYNTDAMRRGVRGEKRTTKKLHFQKFTLSIEEHIQITTRIFT